MNLAQFPLFFEHEANEIFRAMQLRIFESRRYIASHSAAHFSHASAQSLQ
jgi:hypothetical protein